MRRRGFLSSRGRGLLVLAAFGSANVVATVAVGLATQTTGMEPRALAIFDPAKIRVENRARRNRIGDCVTQLP